MFLKFMWARPEQRTNSLHFGKEMDHIQSHVAGLVKVCAQECFLVFHILENFTYIVQLQS